MKKYGIGFEVYGEFGMFADPSSGSDAVTYPLPTFSACRGMIEGICRVSAVKLSVIAVGTCSMPQLFSYTYNSLAITRHPTNVKNKQAVQIRETVLLKPRFQILALLEQDPSGVVPSQHMGKNCAHAMQEQFFRRLYRGQNFYPVSLGRKEFLATYVGPQKTPIEKRYNMVLPSFIGVGFVDGRKVRDVRTNVSVNEGVLEFQPGLVTICDGILKFIDPAIQGPMEAILLKKERKYA